MIIDYLFYRVYNYNIRFGDDLPIFGGILYLGFLSCCIFFFVVMTLELITGGYLSLDHLSSNTKELIYGTYVFIVLVFSTLRYYAKGKIKSLEMKFKNNKKNNLIIDILIILLPFFIFIFTLVLIAIFSKNPVYILGKEFDYISIHN